MTQWDNLWESAFDVEMPVSGQQGIAVVGMAGVCKKAMLNALWGWNAVGESAETVRSFGLFTLIDLPSGSWEAQDILYRLEGAALVVYVVDGTQELSQADFAWIARIRGLGMQVLIAASKLETLNGAAQREVLHALEERLSQPVVPLHATDAAQVREQFVPQMIAACPQIAPRLAAEVKNVRHGVAQQIVIRAATDCLSMTVAGGSAPIDANSLCALQTQMLGQIATLFGHRDPVRRHKALANHAVQQMTCQMLKVIETFPGAPSRLLMRGMGAVMTLVVGWLAMGYYGGGVTRRLPLLPRRSRANGRA